MAREPDTDEYAVAERAMAELKPLIGDPAGPLNELTDIRFEAGPDHTGDPSITFMLEFTADAPVPELDRTDEIEAFIRDTAWNHQDGGHLFVYFRRF